LRNGIEWRVTMYSSYAPASNGVSGGLMGDAADFNGSNTSIDVPNSSDFLSPAFTLEGWLYMNESPTAHGEDETAFAQKSTGSPYRSYGLAESNSSNSTSGNWYNAAGSASYAGTYSGTTTAGAWHYVVLRHDPSQVGSELSVLTDGSTTGTYTASSTGPMFNSNDVLRFGADYDGGSRLVGAMDEIRYHNLALDNNYLQTRFNNINSQYTFWNVGSETASTTSLASTTQNYAESFYYDALGNLAYKSDTGGYTYAGNTGSSYADPDAVTQIANGYATSTYAYDNNGNLTSSGTHGYQWDYLNRMIGAGNGIATSSYAYDAFSNRVKKTVGTTTTMYPNTLYSQSGNTITRNVYDTMGNLVSTVNGGTSTSTVYIHPDILGSTNVITNASGQFLEAMNYRPFGSTNLDLGTTGNESRGYIGQIADPESSLLYLNARYMNPVQGQFLSEDPVFLSTDSMNNDARLQYFSDPQRLNAYSYSGNNPTTQKDPSGKGYVEVGVAFLAGYDAAAGWDWANDVYDNLNDPSVSVYQKLSPRGVDPSLKYNVDGLVAGTTAAAATAAVEAAPTILGEELTEAGAQVIGRIVGGVTNTIGTYIKGTSRNSDGSINPQLAAESFMGGYYGTQAAQLIPGSTANNLAAYGVSIAGANILTEVGRAQLSESLDKLSDYLYSLPTQENQTNSNVKK
jgi:RHS repeat-associated protein